jgi:hypothetical protein
MVVCLGTIYRITDPEIETFNRLEYLSSPKQITTLRGHIFVFILLMTSIVWIVQKSLKSTSVFLETMPALSAWATTTRHDASLVLRPPVCPLLIALYKVCVEVYAYKFTLWQTASHFLYSFSCNKTAMYLSCLCKGLFCQNLSMKSVSPPSRLFFNIYCQAYQMWRPNSRQPMTSNVSLVLCHLV